MVMHNSNYITPTCEEVGINLDSTVLQSSFTPDDFGDGGEIESARGTVSSKLKALTLQTHYGRRTQS